MKKLATFLMTMAILSGFAQKSEQKTKIKIIKDEKGQREIVEKEVDGKITREETYTLNDTSKKSNKNITVTIDKDGNKKVVETIDERVIEETDIPSDGKKSKRVKVMVDDAPREFNDERVIIRKFDMESDSLLEEDIELRGGPRVYKFKNGRRFDSDDVKRRAQNLADDLPRHIQHLDEYVLDVVHGRPMSEKAVGRVRAFTDNPKSENLNVRFTAPKKGDVTITLLDLKGNIVAKEEIKDFTGEFVGSIKTPKDLKGTYFLMIAQGEDGESATIKID